MLANYTIIAIGQLLYQVQPTGSAYLPGSVRLTSQHMPAGQDAPPYLPNIFWKSGVEGGIYVMQHISETGVFLVH
jgi:hypothetical protein